MAKLAVYPGSFDPVTNGHLDVINRASKLFDTLVVAVAINAAKKPLFNAEERVQMIQRACGEMGLTNVRFEYFQGLLHEEVRKLNANAIIRGLRAVSDFEWEFQMALMNRELDESCETLFLMPSPKYSFVSSTMIKEVAMLDGEVSKFVPEFIAEELRSRINN
jgi:pantetheine-phosphate adenylyltransferase